MKLKIQLLSLLLIFGFTIDLAFSQPGMGVRRWRGENHCLMASEINLSPEQKKTLYILQQTYYREAQLLRLEIFAKKIELRELLTNPNTKVEIIRGKNSEIAELQSKQEEKSVEYLIKVRNLLGPEQLKSWCADQEFPFYRHTMPGRRPMGPFSPE